MAPDEMPTSRPTLRAQSGGRIRRRLGIDTGSRRRAPGVQLLGIKPAPMPWMGWGEGAPPEDDGRGRGLHRKHRAAGPSMSTRAVRSVLTPVPTPVMMASSPSGKSARISCAVVRTWMCWPRFWSCCRNPRAGCLRLQLLCRRVYLLALLVAIRVKLRAIGQHQAAAFDAHAVEHHRISWKSPYALYADTDISASG